MKTLRSIAALLAFASISVASAGSNSSTCPYAKSGNRSGNLEHDRNQASYLASKNKTKSEIKAFRRAVSRNNNSAVGN